MTKKDVLTIFWRKKRNKSTYIDIFSSRGHVFGEFSCDDCDCITNLTLGTVIAEELRNTLKDKFNLTTSAGESFMHGFGSVIF